MCSFSKKNYNFILSKTFRCINNFAGHVCRLNPETTIQHETDPFAHFGLSHISSKAFLVLRT